LTLSVATVVPESARTFRGEASKTKAAKRLKLKPLRVLMGLC